MNWISDADKKPSINDYVTKIADEVQRRKPGVDRATARAIGRLIIMNIIRREGTNAAFASEDGAQRAVDRWEEMKR